MEDLFETLANATMPESIERLRENLKEGLDQAISSRGKNKGMLKAKCPPVNTFGAAVWQGIMFHSNYYKMGMGHLLFMSPQVRDVFNYVKKAGEHIDLTTFDRDTNELRQLFNF